MHRSFWRCTRITLDRRFVAANSAMLGSPRGSRVYGAAMAKPAPAPTRLPWLLLPGGAVCLVTSFLLIAESEAFAKAGRAAAPSAPLTFVIDRLVLPMLGRASDPPPAQVASMLRTVLWGGAGIGLVSVALGGWLLVVSRQRGPAA